MVSGSQLKSSRSKSATQRTPKGSNGKPCLNQLSHAYIHHLKLQWTPLASMVSRSQLNSSWFRFATPMGSNDKHLLNQLNHAYIHNLHSQWALKVSRTWLNSSRLYNPNGLQWAPIVSTVWISLTMPVLIISNSNRLHWAPIVSSNQFVLSQLNGLRRAPMVSLVWISVAMPIFITYNSNGLQWAPKVSRSQINSSCFRPATPMDSNGLQW